MKHSKTTLVVTLSVLALVVVGAFAQAAEPAGVGAGPVPKLEELTGPSFDMQFVKSMYQHHSDIAALTTQGIQLLSDKDLKGLSGKIRYEQTKKNEKLAMWSREMNMGKPSVDYSRVQKIEDGLAKYHGRDYDVHYTEALIALLTQSRNAAQLGISRATRPDLRDQAAITAKVSENEIVALKRWLSQKAVGVK